MTTSSAAIVVLLAGLAATTQAVETHSELLEAFDDAGPGERVRVWVLVRGDKGFDSPERLARALEELRRTYDPRATRRRELRRTRPGLFDVDDLPVPPSWVDAVRTTGAEIVVESRWAPGISARVTREQLLEIAGLEFVEELRLVRRGTTRSLLQRVRDDTGKAAPAGFYGEAEQQLQQINVIALHDLGYTGAGVRIGVLDTGFRRSHEAFNDPSHPISVVAEWDFVNDDPNTAPETGDALDQHEHGTAILGAIAAYKPDTLIGSAPDAEYILAKVEDVTSEYLLEEDWFAAGLEFIEQQGGDLATSSLTHYDYYSQAEMDGQTSVMARAVNTATDNGLHVCQGAGNAGHDADPATSSLVTPSDAFKTIAVGSVDSSGVIASFSSDGPTADGRLKPEVLARGVDTRTVSPWLNNATAGYNGASMATPLVCGAAACLLEAHPGWSIDQLRANLFLHADRYLSAGEPDPLYVHGFGIVDALASADHDCNGNGVEDPLDLAALTSGDCNGNAIPDECDVAALISADDAVDGLPDECSECLTGPGCPAEVANLRVAKQYPDLVLSWDVAADAAEYSVSRDSTASGAGETEIARTSQTSWEDTDALTGPPQLVFYLVRGVSPGGVPGP